MECTKTAYDRIEAFVIERHLLTIRLNEIDCGKALTSHADHLGCKIHRHNIGSAVGKPLRKMSCAGRHLKHIGVGEDARLSIIGPKAWLVAGRTNDS